MKRALKIIATLLLGAVAACAGYAGWSSYQAAASTPVPLSKLMPSGALLFLEARDFSALVKDWNQSPEKQLWLKSDNYSAFSRSRLFLRLQEAQRQFTQAAGIPPDMNFLEQAAGQNSALALYDIGKLEFLYISRMPSASAMQNVLWQQRSKFEPRTAAGQQFYVRTDQESGRVVAFAAVNDHLLLATREDLMAGALQLLMTGKGRTIVNEGWYSRAVTSAGKKGELRMVLNLEKIGVTPQFRTYWLPQNITEMRQYAAAVVDLNRNGTEYREDRVLLPGAADEENAESEQEARSITPAGMQAVAELSRLAPGDIGVWRAQANPTAKEAAAAVLQRIIAPHVGVAVKEKLAPQVQLSGGETGSESDLETRIDVTPVARVNSEDPSAALFKALEDAHLQASLQVESSQPDPGAVFVRTQSVLVFSSDGNWNAAAIEDAMQQAAAPGLTAAAIGLKWQENRAGGFFELDGLAPMWLAARGRELFLANSEALLRQVLAKADAKTTSTPAIYLGTFNHQRERDNFLRLTSVVDRAVNQAQAAVMQAQSDQPPAPLGNRQSPVQAQPVEPREPSFFSENIASLSRTWTAVKSESIVVRQEKGKTLQTVVYEWIR